MKLLLVHQLHDHLKRVAKASANLQKRILVMQEAVQLNAPNNRGPIMWCGMRAVTLRICEFVLSGFRHDATQGRQLDVGCRPQLIGYMKKFERFTPTSPPPQRNMPCVWKPLQVLVEPSLADGQMPTFDHLARLVPVYTYRLVISIWSS